MSAQATYETPGAMRRDARRIIEDARALAAATADLADDKISRAREQLLDALDEGRNAYGRLRQRAVAGARATDKVVRDHPYETVGAAFGIGVLVGFLITRRS